MRPALSTKRTLVATALLGTLVVGGCGNSAGRDSGGDSGAVDRPASAVDGPAPKNARGNALNQSIDELSAEMESMRDGDAMGTTAFDVEHAQAGPEDSPRESADLFGDAAIISKAVVSVESGDVEQARFDAVKVMDKYAGRLAADETTTGDDGEMKTARLVMRVPSEDYSAAKRELEKVADFVHSHSGSEDVTTEVIDVEARIRAQEQSLRRIEALLVQATNLRQIIAIESQLSRRQADLDSLKSRQSYLADQTSEATITMHIERTPEKEDQKKDDDDTGFLAGLNNGWDGLVAAAVGVATVIGVLLPFAIVFALIGFPLLMLIRRLRAVPPGSATEYPLGSDG